jgi:hypothetical protein
MAYCPNCGHEIQGGAKFCSNGGQDLHVSVPQDQRIRTENVPVPPPPRPEDSPGSWVGRGFGGGFGAAVGWMLGSCLIILLLSILFMGGCAVLVSLGSNSS